MSRLFRLILRIGLGVCLVVSIPAVGQEMMDPGLAGPEVESPRPPVLKKAVSTGPVRIRGGRLEVDFDGDGRYVRYLIKGVGYSPAAVGYNPDWGYEDPDPRDDNMLNDPAILDRDFLLLAAMHANTLRIWGGDDIQTPMNRFPIKLTRNTFDKASQHGLKLIAGFRMPRRGYWDGGGYQVLTDFSDPAVRAELLARFELFVQSWQDEPALLFWALGNENDLSFSPAGDPEFLAQIQAYYSLVNAMAGRACKAEGADYHPVAAVNGSLDFVGETAFHSADSHLPLLDLWGLNVYPGASFGKSPSFFDLYAAKSKKPLWLSEVSAGDNWYVQDTSHPEQGYEIANLIADLNIALWGEIEAAALVTVGATFMEWSDEWWKPDPWDDCGTGNGSCNHEHNHDGFYPMPGQAPDDYFNEEWWGIVSIEKNPSLYQPDLVTPRETYYALQQVWQ